ncbi:hypothetical protein QWY22_10375 [Planococcus liqunii]|uniref:hypothetical protein n=1 Tax=Planococcus liqunii TaxID=3058394 RepID=UPI0026047890|nr:hypothetical protein [Planococcus sp. N056]WKA49314.1 hypothetical protein QWY22_10375 [Planococcus sp. N056]
MKNDLYIKGIKKEPTCFSAAAQQALMAEVEEETGAQEKSGSSAGNPVWYDDLIDIEKFVESKKL